MCSFNGTSQDMYSYDRRSSSNPVTDYNKRLVSELVASLKTKAKVEVRGGGDVFVDGVLVSISWAIKSANHQQFEYGIDVRVDGNPAEDIRPATYKLRPKDTDRVPTSDIQKLVKKILDRVEDAK